jgi:hypothetical protein
MDQPGKASNASGDGKTVLVGSVAEVAGSSAGRSAAGMETFSEHALARLIREVRCESGGE